MSQQQHLLVRLHREWSALAFRPAVLRRAAGWGVGVPFSSLDGLVAATGYYATSEAREAALASGETDPTAAETVLARLLVVARTDDLAARVVLQRLLPGLSARARCWQSSRRGGSAEALDEMLSAAWLVIRDFPVERRPLHLAANLLRDTEYHAFVKPTRRRWASDSVAPGTLDLPVEVAPEVEPIAELAEVVAAGRRLLSERDMELVRLLVHGRSTGEVAAAMKVSVRTVSNHRDSVVHRLRQAVTAA